MVKKGLYRVLLISMMGLALITAVPGKVSLLAADPPQPVKVSPEDIEKAGALQKREEAVAAKEKEVEQKMKELTALREEVDAKIAKLTEMQAEIQVRLEQFEGKEDLEFNNLVKVFSAMSASKLAPLLNDMPDENVTRVLRAMKTDEAAGIMSKLDKDKAVRVSRLLGLIN